MLYSLPMLCFRCVESNLLHSMTHQSFMLLLKNLKKNLATSRMLSFVCVLCVCVCARVYLYGVCVCACKHVCICTKHFRYEEYSEKKSPTGRKGIVQCSFRDGLPGTGEHYYKSLSFSNNETSHITGDFDIREVLKSVYFFS